LFPIQHEVFINITKRFGHLALFFWDELKANTIYVVWRPKAFLPEKFTVLNTKHRFPCSIKSEKAVESTDMVTTLVLNVPEIVSEMIACGAGAIKDVEFK
jgi:hypothetical protein